MKTAKVFLFVYLFLYSATSSFAGERPHIADGNSGVLTGGSIQFDKSARDTLTLIGPWGSGAQVNGQFETPEGAPDWNDWTHYDITEPLEDHWQISTYQAADLGLSAGEGNLAAWCGSLLYPACSETDAEGGYGNNWNEMLRWVGAVADPFSAVEVNVTGFVNIDTEPGYDYVALEYLSADGPVSVFYQDGNLDNILVEATFYLQPADLQGELNDQAVIQWRITSDGGWSDEDCLHATAGAVQIDDISVTLTQGEIQKVDFTDFESGWGNWVPTIPQGVGDFAQVWARLSDIDPCGNNFTPQVAFIDDGQVVPGVGPTVCVNWCYGPYGYIVNTTGGRLGPDEHLHNAIESPVIPWPGGSFEGALYDFDVF